MTLIEDRLRSHFEATAKDMQAPRLDPAFPARRARRRRQHRLAAFALAAVFGIGGVGVAWSAFGGEEDRPGHKRGGRERADAHRSA
jgi:hypothetical protein